MFFLGHVLSKMSVTQHHMTTSEHFDLLSCYGLGGRVLGTDPNSDMVASHHIKQH